MRMIRVIAVGLASVVAVMLVAPTPAAQASVDRVWHDLAGDARTPSSRLLDQTTTIARAADMRAFAAISHPGRLELRWRVAALPKDLGSLHLLESVDFWRADKHGHISMGWSKICHCFGPHPMGTLIVAHPPGKPLRATWEHPECASSNCTVDGQGDCVAGCLTYPGMKVGRSGDTVKVWIPTRDLPRRVYLAMAETGAWWPDPAKKVGEDQHRINHAIMP